MLHLIDVSHIIHPMYHGFPKMVRPTDGHPVGAVHGVCYSFWRLALEQPSHVAVVYDAPGGSKARKAKFPDYKATRKPYPEDLAKQLPLVRRAADIFDFARVEVEGYESDDVIATYCRLAAARGLEVTIVSSDKDCAQLVRWDDGQAPAVSMRDPKKEITYNPDGVREKHGVPPHQIADFLALMGDVSDNIPGVDKIGEKTAAALLTQFGSLEAILDRVDEVSKPNIQMSLRQHGWKGRLSKTLTVLDDHVPVEHDIEEFAYGGFDKDKVLEFLDEMQLVTLRADIEKGERVAA